METNKTVGKGFLKCLPSTLNTQKVHSQRKLVENSCFKGFLVNAVNSIIIIRPEANVLLITPH
jgi:hypothetical protein